MYLGLKLVQGVVAWVPAYTQPPTESTALMRARAASEPRPRVVPKNTAGVTRSRTLVQERTARIVSEAHPHRSDRLQQTTQHLVPLAVARTATEGNARSRAQSAPWVQSRLETTWPSQVVRPTEAAAIRQSGQELLSLIHI